LESVVVLVVFDPLGAGGLIGRVMDKDNGGTERSQQQANH